MPSDATNVVFAAGEVTTGPIVLADRALSFTANPAGTTVVVGASSGFDLSGGNWVFRGISFRGTGERPDTTYDGGAICCSGGTLTLENCAFSHLNSRFTGGAVSACLMDGDVVVSNCTFAGNVAGPLNGMGGALYASRGPSGTGTLRLDGCTFRGNSAQNGGAVATVRVIDDDELPMSVVMTGCAFRGNTADYSGGAIDDEGDLSVANTLFADNGAAVQGGAICMGTSDPDWPGADLSLSAGTVFRGNQATNAVADSRYWTSGGAVAVADAGFSLSASGRHVVFEGNRASSRSSSYGGAISAAAGTDVEIACAAFLANAADSSGGAVSSWGNALKIGTSIFSNNTVVSTHGFGGAVAVESGAALVMSNSTVRGSNRNAVDAYRARATLVNCVVADNNDEADLSVGGASGAELVLDHTSYGRAEVEEGTPVTTNACLSGRGASIYRDATLYLDSQEAYLPEAGEGLVQSADDFDGVRYGSRPAGYSMGAYECPTPTEIEIVDVTWYHNRSDGLYYPKLEIRFVGGDAGRIEGVTLTCADADHELSSEDVARLRTMKPGEVQAFGVDPTTFKQHPNSPVNSGFVPPENRLFGVYDATRPIGFSVAVKGTLRMAEVVSVPRTARAVLAERQTQTIPVAARFADFRVGEFVSGQAEAMSGAQVRLLGSAALDGEWISVPEFEIDAGGRFRAKIPDGLFFFRLEAEVSR